MKVVVYVKLHRPKTHNFSFIVPAIRPKQNSPKNKAALVSWFLKHTAFGETALLTQYWIQIGHYELSRLNFKCL